MVDESVFKDTLECNEELCRLTKQAEYYFESNLPEYVRKCVNMTQTVYSYDYGLLLYVTVDSDDTDSVKDYFELKYGEYDNLIKDNLVTHIGVSYNRIIGCLG